MFPKPHSKTELRVEVSVDAVVGQKPLLTEEEDKLETYLIDSCDMGVGNTKNQVKEMALPLSTEACIGAIKLSS